MLRILAPSTRGSLSIVSSIPANLIKKPSVCTSIRVLSTPASSTPPSKALAGRSNCATPPNTASQAIDVHPHLKGGGFQAWRLGRDRGGFLLLTTDCIVHFTGDPG